MTKRVIIVGCGIVGAMTAYELSRVPDLDVVVLEQHQPAEGSTSAALGVLMGIISHKVKGRTWRLRRDSIQRYHTLIDELADQTGHNIPFNTQGILSLCFEPERLPKWESLQTIRAQQGWPLEIWSPAQVAERCPHLNLENVVAGIYSPQDGQVCPTTLTTALVQAAQQQGATFRMGTTVTGLSADQDGTGQLAISDDCLQADWIVLAGGIGTHALIAQTLEPVSLIPVFGQALRVEVSQSLGNSDFQPIINGQDVHLVPHGKRQYSLGATVEFPAVPETASLQNFQPDPVVFANMQQVAAKYCPALSKAEPLQTWHHLRPRPQGQPAPVIQPLSGFKNVTLATGHYRNGVLLAPATALRVKAQILEGLGL
ncbi:MAG: FAD-dependent oxidoreductase [Cyanobacteria bacterium J06632_22]